MGMDSAPISGVGRIDRKEKPAQNKIQFASEFNNFMNKLRSGQPVIGNLLNGQDSQATQQAFRN